MAGHGHVHDAPPLSRHARRLVAAVLTLAVAGVVAGLALLWPGGSVSLPAAYAANGLPTTDVAGYVTSSGLGACGGPADTAGGLDGSAPLGTGGGTAYTCNRVHVSIRSGPDKGRSTTLELSPGPGIPTLHAGDDIRLARSVDVTGAVNYDFADYSRGVPLAVLAIVFAVVVVLVGRWRGLAALIGLALTAAVLVVFTLPALLRGSTPLGVALVSGAALLLVVMPLVHGLGSKTAAALAGTLLALALTGGVALLAVHVTHLTGLQDEQNTALAAYDSRVSIPGVLLAGFVIGGLGILNDVTVSQAATVMELAAADPAGGPVRWSLAAMRVGRDHIASAVYTLATAYAGSALPVLLLFGIAGRSVHDLVTSDVVADELVRSLVGGIGLVLAVPVTTAVAAALAARSRIEA